MSTGIQRFRGLLAASDSGLALTPIAISAPGLITGSTNKDVGGSISGANGCPMAFHGDGCGKCACGEKLSRSASICVCCERWRCEKCCDSRAYAFGEELKSYFNERVLGNSEFNRSEFTKFNASFCRNYRQFSRLETISNLRASGFFDLAPNDVLKKCCDELVGDVSVSMCDSCRKSFPVFAVNWPCAVVELKEVPSQRPASIAMVIIEYFGVVDAYAICMHKILPEFQGGEDYQRGEDYRVLEYMREYFMCKWGAGSSSLVGLSAPINRKLIAIKNEMRKKEKVNNFILRLGSEGPKYNFAAWMCVLKLSRLKFMATVVASTENQAKIKILEAAFDCEGIKMSCATSVAADAYIDHIARHLLGHPLQKVEETAVVHLS